METGVICTGSSCLLWLRFFEDAVIMSCVTDNSCGSSNIIALNRMWALWAPHVAVQKQLLCACALVEVDHFFLSCSGLLHCLHFTYRILRDERHRCVPWNSARLATCWSLAVHGVSGALSCTWVPDIHTFLPGVSGNFLPLCRCKCLQRHQPMFNVADMCCTGGRNYLPSGDVLKIGVLLYTCWYLFSFPTLRAAFGILCKDAFLA